MKKYQIVDNLHKFLENNKKDFYNLMIILFIGIIHGFLYVFLIPPWQHYDEPKHFEYVWLVAKNKDLPRIDEKDEVFNLKVMESMLRNDFFRGVGYKPDINNLGKSVDIFGLSQLTNKPFYYIIASFPLVIAYYLPVEIQLILVRFVSLFFLLLTILSSWGISIQLTKNGHPLRWMMPLTIALLPGFVELMTAVNNDVASIGFFSLFLWGSVVLLHNNFKISNLIWVISTAVLTYFVKNTAMIALILLPYVILLAVLKNKKRRFAWLIIITSLIFVSIITFRWGDPAFWYRGSSQTEPIRIKKNPAPVGDYVFYIDTKSISDHYSLFQIIPNNIFHNLAGKEVTFGGWMWSDQMLTTKTPVLVSDGELFSKEIIVNQTPSFFSFSAIIPSEVNRIWIKIIPEFSTDIDSNVYYDGLFLVEGSLNTKTRITYKDIYASQIGWNDSIKPNFIRNGSAERAGPGIRPFIDRLSASFIPDHGRSSIILSSIYDLEGSSVFYRSTIKNLFYSFWAKFGWGHILLKPNGVYLLLWIITSFAVLGSILFVFRKTNFSLWDISFIFGFALIISWSMTITRGAIYLDLPGYYIPVARYSYPVIIPTVMIIVFGWIKWGEYINKILLKNSKFSKILKYKYIENGYFFYGLFFLTLFIIGIISFRSIISYYQCAGV
jgi:hypothetical protein